MELPSAAECFQQANSLNNVKHMQMLDKIINKIKDAVSKGEMSCTIFEPITSVVREELTRKGYKMSEYDSQHDGTTITISWSHINLKEVYTNGGYR